MNMLHTEGNKIFDSAGKEVRFRGTSIGAWMNMENFMNGFPGNENNLRRQAMDILGKEKGSFIFESFLNHFFNEKDVTFLEKKRVNVVRIPLNYRHFEDDMNPYAYLESGFERLNQALDWCEKHGIYVVLDMHAAPGYQSSDWHCDNPSRKSLFWTMKEFQDRFIALWEEFARRYKGRSVVAAYDLLNEPMTHSEYGRMTFAHIPDWDNMNNLYKRCVNAIRKIDPDHIICLEGDFFAMKFSGLDAPFADNLVYHSHNYSTGLGDSNYGKDGAEWDKYKVREEFYNHEGTKFAQKYNVPLWIGEFGAHSPENEIPQIVLDQIDVFEEFGAQWTVWSYKDCGIMGQVRYAPDCVYFETFKNIMPYVEKFGKYPIAAARTQMNQEIDHLADLIESGFPINLQEGFDSNRSVLKTTIDDVYYFAALQPAYLKVFEKLSLEQIDEIMSSFEFDKCVIHETAKIFDRFNQ